MAHYRHDLPSMLPFCKNEDTIHKAEVLTDKTGNQYILIQITIQIIHILAFYFVKIGTDNPPNKILQNWQMLMEH
uniref:Uncharacterized protein n=1 Tax=Rhizophora mucronata TaxID=61149 RepID=A0A2P2QYI2_RHIMU